MVLSQFCLLLVYEALKLFITMIDGKKVRSFLSRSCTDDFIAADECFISDGDFTPDGQIEYTCVSTCDTDGCNTETRKAHIRYQSKLLTSE